MSGPSLVAHSPVNPSGLAAPVGEVAAADAVVAAAPSGPPLYYQFGSHHQGTVTSTGHGVPGSVGEAMHTPQPHLSPKILSGSHLDAPTYHSSNPSSYRHHTPQPTRQMPPPTNYPSDSAPASLHHQRQHPQSGRNTTFPATLCRTNSSSLLPFGIALQPRLAAHTPVKLLVALSGL